MVLRYVLIMVLVFFLIPSISASNPPNVTIVSPSDLNISTTNNITFTCNVTDDQSIVSVSLYNNISGDFNLYGTRRVMELEKDSFTELLCHFNNQYICEDGETGINSSTEFIDSRFVRGVKINESDTLRYYSDNLEYNQGTIEMWLRLGFDPSVDDKRIFSTGTSSIDEIQIYTSSGNMYFYFYDQYGYSKNVYKDVSSWNTDEWHHLAFVWDLLVGGGDLDMFLDGDNSLVTESGSFYYYGNSFDEYMYVGSHADGTGQANSTFDELRISNVTRSQSEINTSFVKGNYSYPNQSVNWTITSIPDGIYAWNCMAYDNESQESWNDTNRTLYVDTISPQANYILLSPNSSSDVDPDMYINITSNVTDLINVSYVVLQWKETGQWINDTMEYNSSSGLYQNASMNIDQTGGTYYYRIWSNDTLGHFGHTSTYNITAEWDYTWSSDPSNFGTVYGIVGCSNCYVGTLTINNTGDDTLSIQFTDNWPLTISYNVSNPFNIGPKNVTVINVTAGFSSENSEYPVVINISASHGSETPSPLYRTVNVTINSYSGGPYFDSDDLSLVYTTSLYQSVNYSFSATLTNIGNESTYSAWINWTLASGMANVSGDSSQYIGTLNGTSSGGNTEFNNITVYIDPDDVSAGVKTIFVNASSNDSLTANASITVYVLCNSTDSVCGEGCSYVTDNDCSIPTSPGGGSSTTAPPTFAAAEPNIDLAAPERIWINRGESENILASVHNTVVGTVIKDVKLTVSGHPQVHLNITPSVIDELGYNDKKNFAVRIEVPEYMAYGEYELTFKAQGTYSDSTVSDTFKTILSVYGVTENETREAFQEADDMIQDMDDAGFNTDHLDALLDQAGKSLKEWDFDRADELADEILDTGNLAFKIDMVMKNLEKDINKAESYGIGAPETKKMHSLAMTAFQRGDYERAWERSESALLTYSMETYGLVGALGFAHEYWWAIAMIILIFSVITWRTHKVVVIRSIAGSLKRIENEEKSIFEMIKDYQKRYWQDRSISSEDYHGWLSESEKRMKDIMGIRAELNIRKIRVTADNLLNGLESEIKSVSRRINDLQKKYFSGEGVSKVGYLMMMNGLNTEMTNIQNALDAEKTRSGNKPGKGKKIAGVIVAIIIIAILLAFFVPYAGALSDQDRAMEAMSNAEAEMQSMQELGFGTIYANDTLKEAKLLYGQGHYLAAESLALKVTEIKELAIETDSLIDQVEGMIYESRILGIDVSPAEALFSQVLSAFEIEDYVQSNEFLTQAINKLDELESESILQATTQKTWYTDIASLIWENQILSIALVLVLITVVPVTHLARKSGKIMKRLKDLEKEKESLSKSIKDLQVRYFSESKISKSEYERMRDHYRKRSSEIERNIKLIRR